MKFLKIAGISVLILGFLGAIVLASSNKMDKPNQAQTAQADNTQNQIKTQESESTVSDNKKSDISQTTSNDNEQGDSKMQEKLNKIKELEKLQKQKNFMLTVAQDDLEHYTWGEKSEFPDIWRQAYLEYNIDGNLVMLALEHDLAIYLTFGDSHYALVWATADLTYEAYKDGKLKANMTEQKYQKLVDNLNAVNQRLGIIYAKREYVPQLNNYNQTQQAPY